MAARTSLSSVEAARAQPWRRRRSSWWSCCTSLVVVLALITLLDGILVAYARPAPQASSAAPVTVAIPLLDQLPPPLRVNQPYFFQLHPQMFTSSSSSRITVSTGTLPSWLMFNASSWQLVAASVPSLVGASAIAVDFFATASTTRPRTPTASLVIPYTTNTIALANPIIYQWFRVTDLPAGARVVRAALNSSSATANDALVVAVDPPTDAPNRVFRLPVPDAPFTAATASGSPATIVSYRVFDVDRGRTPDWAAWDDQARSIALTISSEPALGNFRLALVPSDLPNWTGGPRDAFTLKVGNRAPVWAGPASNATAAAPMVVNVTRGNAVTVNMAAWVQDPDKDAVLFSVRPATGQVAPPDMVVGSTTVTIPNVTRSVHLTVTAADVVNATTPAQLDLLVAVDGILPLEVVPRCARVPRGMPCVRLTTAPGAVWSWTVPTGLFVPAAGTSLANYTVLSTPSWLAWDSTSRTLNGTVPKDDGASYALQVQAQDSRGGIAVVPILLSAKSDPPADTSMFVTTLVALLTLGGMFVILAALVYKKPWKKVAKLARRDTRRPRREDACKTTTSTVSARLEDSFMDVADDDSGPPPVRTGGGARDSGSIHTLLPPRMAAALIRNSSPASANASPPHKPTVTFQLPTPSTGTGGGGGGTQIVGAWRAGPLLAVPQAAGLDQSFRSHHGSVLETSATMTSLASNAGGASPPPHDALAPPAESYYPPVRHSSVRSGLPVDRPCLAPFDWEGRRASTLMPPYIADPSSDESGSATSTSRSSTPTSTSVDGIVKMLESGSHETVTKSETTSASTSPGGSSSSTTEYEECSSTASKDTASTTESTASMSSSVANPVRLYERAAYWDAMRVSSGSGSQPPTPALPHDLQISVPPAVPAILVTPTSTTSTTLGGSTRPGPSPTSAKPPLTPVSPIHNPVVRRLIAYPSIPFQYILTLPAGLDQEHVYTAIHPPPSRPPSDLGSPGPVIHSAQSPRPLARDVARMTYPHRFYAAPAAATHEDLGVPTPVSALGLTFSNATQLHLPVPWLDMDVDAGRRSGVLRGTPGAADVGEWQVDVFDQVPSRPVWKAVITVKLM
ncbi:hypothetical protein GGF32_003697 [Allomyces javanicus]|nr:hypothetical protein GGF32_003697 [Allomyces javanicus]